MRPLLALKELLRKFSLNRLSVLILLLSVIVFLPILLALKSRSVSWQRRVLSRILMLNLLRITSVQVILFGIVPLLKVSTLFGTISSNSNIFLWMTKQSPIALLALTFFFVLTILSIDVLKNYAIVYVTKSLLVSSEIGFRFSIGLLNGKKLSFFALSFLTLIFFAIQIYCLPMMAMNLSKQNNSFTFKFFYLCVFVGVLVAAVVGVLLGFILSLVAESGFNT